jgi:hypothetical protein
MLVAQLSEPHIVEPGKSPRTPAGFGSRVEGDA